MEQDSDSMCSSEEETSTESKSRNWSELNTADLPRAGGVSTNYSQKNDNSSFKTQVSLKHWPNPDGKLSDSTISPDSQSTVSKLVDRLEALESSYQDIQKQLSTHKMMLEENHKRSLQTDELIRQFIGTFSTPLSKLLNIEESPNKETNTAKVSNPQQDPIPDPNQNSNKVASRNHTEQHPGPGDNRVGEE